MVLAYDFPILGFFWSVLILFIWLAWFMLLFRVVVDIFRAKDMGGLAKACWLLFTAMVPFLGVFLYLIVRGNKLAENEMSDAKAQQDAFAQYVQSVSGGGVSTADELAKLADLQAKGVISEAEFAAQKARLLS
ncbi:MAG: SHOCT domain-containing protein [Acidimicrobiales bacterium]